MKAILLSRASFIFLIFWVILAPLFSQGGETGKIVPLAIFGPYEAIAWKPHVVRDVKVDKEGKIFLKLDPSHKGKEIIVKISDKRFASYRDWWNGSRELVSPANPEKPSLAWTDWVQVKAKYIEYWMDGEIFLHLRRSNH